VQYTFFSAGYGFGPFTFSNIVPVKFWSDSYQVDNGIVDTKGRPFNDFLADALYSDFLKNDEARSNRFKRQFMQNHADREQFTKSVKVDVNKIFTPKAGRTAEQMDYDTTMAARNDKGGVIVTTKGNLIVNRDKNPQLFPFGKKADSINKIGKSAPMKYIKVYNKTGGGYRLFEYKETAFDQKNNDLYEGRNKIDTVTYFPINTLGTSNFVLEFNFYDDINETAVPKKKKVIAKGPMAQMEAEMDRITQESIDEIPTGDIQDLSSLRPTVAPITQPSTSVEYNYNPSNVSEKTRDDYKQYVLKQLGKPEIKAKANAFDFIYPDLTITISKDGSLSYTNVNQKIVDLSKTDSGYDLKFMVGLNKLAEEFTQASTSVKPLSLADIADTGLSAKQEGTAPPAVPKTLTLAQMADVNAKEPMGLFEKLEANDFEEYTKAGGTELSKKDFLSLSAQDQANAIYQAKNCK